VITVPIITDNPQAWPPPEVRKEVADTVVEEVKGIHGDQAGRAGWYIKYSTDKAQR